MARDSAKSQGAYLRGMGNRIAHDCGAADFKMVWTVTQSEIGPLVASLGSHLPEI